MILLFFGFFCQHGEIDGVLSYFPSIMKPAITQISINYRKGCLVYETSKVTFSKETVHTKNQSFTWTAVTSDSQINLICDFNLVILYVLRYAHSQVLSIP